MIETELKEWGNSIGVLLPIEKVRELGLKKGDKVKLDIIGKKRVDAFGVCRGAKPFKEEKENHSEFW
ncbi:hypothetical protein HYX10_03975 [Candidatus Woesearchaeota archaeon]|nr:hypothetical protein [Candidatus Woesearchaeota archaeon]